MNSEVLTSQMASHELNESHFTCLLGCEPSNRLFIIHLECFSFLNGPKVCAATCRCKKSFNCEKIHSPNAISPVECNLTGRECSCFEKTKCLKCCSCFLWNDVSEYLQFVEEVHRKSTRDTTP